LIALPASIKLIDGNEFGILGERFSLAMANASATAITQRLIQFNTINPPGDEQDCTRHLGAMLESAGFEINYFEYDERRTSLIARLAGRGTKPPFCFGGHVDVVPLGLAPWSVEPFAAKVEDGKLFGRGSSDMKSGVAAFVHAGLRLAQTEERAADVVLLIVAGEETGCDGSKHVAELGVLPECGAVVIAEPTSNYPYLGHRGALWLEGTVTGRTAHGSMPELGENAVYKAARAVTKLEDFGFNERPDPLLGSTTLNVGTFEGGININSVPDRAKFTIDIRTIPGRDHAATVMELGQYLGPEVELTTKVDVVPVLTDAEDPWVQETFTLLEPVLGEQPEPRGAPYFTDASALTPACGNPPTLIMGPGEMAQAHQSDEFCVVDRIEEAAELYHAMARRWCGLL